MYGLSAKEKAARFQASSNSNNNNTSSVSSRPRKIGKLNIGPGLDTSKSTTKKTTTKKVVKTKTSTKTTMKERKEQQSEAVADDSVVAVLEKTDATEESETTVAAGFVISADVTTDEADVSTEPAETVASLVASEASDTMIMDISPVSVSTSEAEPTESTAIDTPELSFSFTTSTDEPELDLTAELQVNAALQLTSADTTEVEEEQDEEEDRKKDQLDSDVAGEFQMSVDVSVDETAETISHEVAVEEGTKVRATIESVDVEVEGASKAEEPELKADEEDGAKVEQEAKAEEEPRLKAEEEGRVKAEEDARLNAEEEARLNAEEEGRVKAEEEARLNAEDEARLKVEEDARLKTEEEVRLKAEEEARLKAEEDARLKAVEEARLKAEEARKPKETETDKAIKKTFIESCPAFQPIPDEFYSKLFYFSGMGTLIGSSLSAGIYVPEDTAKCGLGAEQVESCVPESFDKHVEMVKTARNHATDLTAELRKLQALLQGLPIFTGEGAASGSQTWRTTRHTSLSSGTTSHRTRASSYGGITASQPPPPAPAPAPAQRAQDTFNSVSAVPAQQPASATSAGGCGGRAVSSSGYPGGVASSNAYPTVVTSTNGYAGEATVGAQYPFQLPDQRRRVSSSRQAMRNERDVDKVDGPAQRPAPPPVQPKPRLVVTDATASTPTWTPRHRPWEQPAPDTLDVPRRRRARSLVTPPAAPVSPVSPVNRNYGVFTAQGHSWQDKYGKAGVVDQPIPKPFGGVNVPSSGLKTWQMSRLRGLEAKGYLLDSEQVYIENTPARRASAAAAHTSQIDSYAPYLVSAKSRVIDYAAKPMSPTSAKAFQPRVQNGFGGSLTQLPYCDL